MNLMPWGKHRGQPIGELPLSYLVWLLENADGAREPALRRAIALAVHNRVGCPWDGADMLPRQELKMILRAWFREQALAHHPDRGGSHEAMTALNQAHDALQRLLDEPSVN